MKRFILMVIVLMLLSCDCKNPFDTTYKVKYAVLGSAESVFVTFETAGGTSQQDNCQLPWQYDFTAKSGAFLYISAQNEHDSGNLTVKIFVNGKPKKSSTSSGAYVIATASMSL